LSVNSRYLIQGHSCRTHAACSSPSGTMRTFVCNTSISAIFTKPIGHSFYNSEFIGVATNS
jgi:hypothetical protein